MSLDLDALSEIQVLKSEIENLKTPVRQALERSEREAENIMYELKHVQKKYREVFSEFDRAKSKMLAILEAVCTEGAPVPPMHHTLSMVNLDAQLLACSQNQSDTIFTTVRNTPMSPITQAWTASAQTLFSKTSLAKLPILKSKHGYMTARDASRNLLVSGSDFRSFDTATIKETEEDELRGMPSLILCIDTKLELDKRQASYCNSQMTQSK